MCAPAPACSPTSLASSLVCAHISARRQPASRVQLTPAAAHCAHDTDIREGKRTSFLKLRRRSHSGRSGCGVLRLYMLALPSTAATRSHGSAFHSPLPPHPLQGGLLETDLYDMPKGFEAKDVASVGGELWKEQLKLPKEEQRYGKGERASEPRSLGGRGPRGGGRQAGWLGGSQLPPAPQLPWRLDEPLALVEGAPSHPATHSRSLALCAASDHNDAD